MTRPALVDMHAPRRGESHLSPPFFRRGPWGAFSVEEAPGGWIVRYRSDSGWSERFSGPHESPQEADEAAVVARAQDWARYGRGGSERPPRGDS